MGRSLYDELAGPKAKSAKRRMAGARGHAQGHGFERSLDDLHIHYRSARRAWVEKVPSPYRVLKVLGGGRFTGAFEGEGPPDYTGIVAGRTVVFDAKQTSDTRWGFDHLAIHQAGALEEVASYGGFAFVLLWMGGIVWVLPWSELGPRWCAWRDTEKAKRGEGSLTVANIDAIGHRCQGCDWLPVVAKLLGAP